MATPTNALDKIEELQKQIELLKQEAIDELKQQLNEARGAVAELEDELTELTGKPAEAGTRARRNRRPSITDEALRGQILKAMAAEGKTGLNAKEIAGKVNQDPLRIRRFIRDNPKALKRQGAGAGTKFFLP